jgi:hypothetical protein
MLTLTGVSWISARRERERDHHGLPRHGVPFLPSHFWGYGLCTHGPPTPFHFHVCVLFFILSAVWTFDTRLTKTDAWGHRDGLDGWMHTIAIARLTMLLSIM